MKAKKNTKNKFRKNAITVILIFTLLFPGYTWLLNDFFVNTSKNAEEIKDDKRRLSYDPLLGEYSYIKNVNQISYEFNAKGESYILADLKGTDFTSFLLDDEQYNVSYGINIFTKDFGDDFTVHSLEFQQSDINENNFKWVCVEPLFLAQDNITVNLDQLETVYFNAGGPISILMQPNFAYNWLYLEVDGVVINDIYPTEEYPEIDSAFFSYFIEDGAYIRFDLDTIPKEHVMKVKGNGTIEYKILVNLDWDEDLIHDVEEVQKELFIEDLDPTIPNFWGFFEKSREFCNAEEVDETREGSFRFYVPDSVETINYLTLTLFSGTIFDIQIDDNKLILKDIVLTNYFDTPGILQPVGRTTSGYHTLYYNYKSSETTKISFAISGREVIIFDKAEFRDTDGDGLKDIEERNSGLDPYSSDTDNDGLPDNIDASPLYSLTLDKDNIHQFVIPHDPTKNTLISMSIKRPNTDYSTFATPRLYRGDLNISIYFYMRIFGNQSITRTDLTNFWKDGETNVDSYCLVDGYDCNGVGDALPIETNPNAEYTFINSKLSESTYEFDLTFSIDNPAKDDNAIDLRFDFIWIVTSFDSESGNTSLLHIYEMEENLKLQSFGCREIGNINYKLASPDSMIENQILWALTQNPALGSTSSFDVNDDIVGQGTVDFVNLPEKVEEDRCKTPIYSELLGEEMTEIIRPNEDIYSVPTWYPSDTSHANRINEVNPDSTVIYAIRCNTDKLGFTDIGIKDSSRVTQLKFHIYGRYTTDPPEAILSWRLGDDVYSSEKTINFGTSFSWKTLIWTCDVTPSRINELNIKLRSYRSPSNPGDGKVEISTLYCEVVYKEVGKPLENEVLYIAGLQKNLDVLNKINIQQNLVNPSFETLHSGDYESFFSYYTVSNVYDSSEIQFLDEALRGEHKICYSITWNNYTEDGIEDYEKRATIQGLPIFMETLSFPNSKVLKVTQAMGNEIPLEQIPQTILSEMHDKIIFWNQTFIQATETEEGIPTLDFNDIEDIYKEFFDNRPWKIEASKIIFSTYSPAWVFEFTEFIDCYKSNFYFFTDYLQEAARISPTLSNFLKKLNKWSYSAPPLFNVGSAQRSKLLSLEELKNIYKDHNLDLAKVRNEIINENPNLYYTLEDCGRNLQDTRELEALIKNQHDPFSKLRCWLHKEENRIRLKNGMIGGALIAFGIFLTIHASIQLFQLHYKRDDYAGRETEFLFRQLAAICSAALGIVLTIYGILLLKQAISRGASSIILDNVDEIAEKAMMKFCKFLGKLMNIIGILLDLFNFLSNLAYALSIMDENPELATQLIIQTLIFDLGFGIAWGVLTTVLGGTAAAAFVVMGIAIIALIIFAMIFMFFVEPPPDELFYPLNIELDMQYSKDAIKKHGGFEVGDEVIFDIGLRHIGDIEDTGRWPKGIKAKFQLQLNYSSSNVDGWSEEKGRWDDRIEIEPYASFGYYFGETSYPAFWPEYADDYQCFGHVGDTWPAGEDLTYESYSVDRTLMYATTGLTLELKMTKDKYNALENPHNEPGLENYYYDRSPWVEDEIIRVNLGIPVLETSMSVFYSHTVALPELTNLDTLETKMKLALAQYQYKDANEILLQIQQRDPDYEYDIPINTNIATNLRENIIELDPSTGSVETDFSLILEGTDLPDVDYTFISPDGFSINPLSITQPITNNIVIQISANDPNELGGLYYFDMEIRRHDTGELIYTEKVPFRIPFVKDFHYTQSNILYHDTSIYDEILISSVLDPPLGLDKGQIVNIKCKVNTSNEVLLEFMNNGNTIDTYTVVSRGNTDFGYQFTQIIIRKDITFDQFKFSVNLETGQNFMAYDILMMDSLITTPSGEYFNPISITNDGNIIEYIECTFSGIPFNYVDKTMYPEEFFQKTQLIALMPGEHRNCLFNIVEPVDPIDNLYWRGIKTYHPNTAEIYTGYMDSLRIEGIHIQTPRNLSYNIYGINTYFEEGIPLEIVTEEDLVWTAYSLDSAENIIFSERTYIPIPELNGVHTLKVYGENSLNEIITSETRYFTINHPITILSPENRTITSPSLGYYIATYGFEAGKFGIDIEDWIFDTSGGSALVINEVNDHCRVLQLKDTHSSQNVSITDSFESSQASGTIEFWIRTTDASKQTIIRIQDGNYTNSIDFRILDGNFQYYSSAFNTITTCENNQWYHLRFEFDCTSDWHLLIDGESQDGGIGYNFRGNPRLMTQFFLSTHNGAKEYKTFIDAIGYSWDSDYILGDNLKEGILTEVIPQIQLTDLNYILNDNNPIYSPTSSVIPILDTGNYFIIFYGIDEFGYEWHSEKRCFIVDEDLDPPEITNIQVSSNLLEHGDLQIITCSVYDLSGVSSVSAYIQYPDEYTIAELPMTNTGGNTFEAVWNYGEVSLGTYYVDIDAVDASFNLNSIHIENGYEFEIQDTTWPSIFNLDMGDIPETGQSYAITCEVYDSFGVESVYAHIQQPDGTDFEILPMSHQGGGVYKVLWDSTGAPLGVTYYIDFKATDMNSNENILDNGIEFILEDHVISVYKIDVTVPTITSQLKYNDGTKLRISRKLYENTYSVSAFSKSYSYVYLQGASGSVSSGMATKNDGVTYYHWCTGNWFVHPMYAYQYFTFNVGTDKYIDSINFKYYTRWTIGDDPVGYSWSKLYRYRFDTNQWELWQTSPLSAGYWISRAYYRSNYGNPLATYTDRYVSSSGEMRFQFTEYTYDSGWFRSPQHYLTWDYVKLEVDYYQKNCEVEFNFDTGILNGNNDYITYFEGITNEGTAYFKIDGANKFNIGTSGITRTDIYYNIDSIKINLGTAKYVDVDFLYLKQIN